jgi:hypothetical protein
MSEKPLVSDLTIPELDLRLPGAVKKGRRTYDPGTAILCPGQMVEALYQIHRGRVDMVSELGTSREARETFSRDSDDQFSPMLGGRYFFTKRPSSRHYIAVTSVEAIILDYDVLKRMFKNRDGSTLPIVRELLRSSDMLVEEAKMELAVRHVTTGASGFKYDAANLDGLLRHNKKDAYTKNPDFLQFIEEQFLEFAQSILLRWCGEWIKDDVGGEEVTNIKLEPYKIGL